MPAQSKKQFRFMEEAEHNPSFAKKVGIKRKMAKEFIEENKGKKAYKKLPAKKNNW